MNPSHPNRSSKKNLMLLFFTIALWFASVATFADLNISSDINNARQTIAHMTITEDWLDSQSPLFDVSSWGIFIKTDRIQPGWYPYSGKLLGIDMDGKVKYMWVADLNLSWWNGSYSWDDGDRTMVGNNIYRYTGNVGIGTTNPTQKLHIVNSGSTDVYIEETANGMAANLNLKNPVRTRAMWWDSYPDVFYIGEAGKDIAFSINSWRNIGIWTISQDEKLEISWGNVRINNLKSKVVLGTDNNGTIKWSTSGEVYNYISGLIAEAAVWAAGANTQIQFNSGGVLRANNNLVRTSGRLWIGLANPNNIIQVKDYINFPNGGASTYLGYKAWENVWDNMHNIAIGQNALNSAQWGNNIAIGIQAWYQTLGSGNVFLWYQAGYEETESNRLYIMNGVGQPLIYGEFDTNKLGINATNPTTTLDINGDLRIRTITDDPAQQYILAVDGYGKVYKLNKNTLSGSSNWSGDNLGNHIAIMNLEMSTFWIRHLGAGASMDTCSLAESGSMKFKDNCFQGCDGSNWVVMWWTCIWWSVVCGNGIRENGEQCDDGNTSNNDWCNSGCQWETEIQSCINIPSNAIANTVTSISQTCQASNGTICILWMPSNYYAYSITGSTTACYFKCDTGYERDGNSCTLQIWCGNDVVQTGEQCDDGNINNDDWCSETCQWETPPCTFSFTPTTGTIPLTVTFMWTEKNRALYRLNLGNGYGFNNQVSFSWVSYTYTTSWTFTPILTAKNKYDINTSTSCYGSVTTTIQANPSPKVCWDGIIQKPNDSGHNEQCDDGTQNSSTWMCSTGCIYNTPDCSIFANPWILTWGSGKIDVTWDTSTWANYIIKITDQYGNQAWSSIQLTPWGSTFLENVPFDTTGSYIITLWSVDWLWISCSTTVDVYDNDEFACGIYHRTDQYDLTDTIAWLCANGYSPINFTGDHNTIRNVWWKTWAKVAILYTVSDSNNFSYTMIDSGKNMVQYTWLHQTGVESYYIKFARKVLGLDVTILLPEQWYAYRTRQCEKEKTIVSSCFAHKSLNGSCAYDMNIDDSVQAQYLTQEQISGAMMNSGFLFKCALLDYPDQFDEPIQKYTRWLPGTNPRGNGACEVIPMGPTIETNLYYLHRTCPWYNYGKPSESCDSVIMSGQWLASCAELFNSLYVHTWTTLTQQGW